MIIPLLSTISLYLNPMVISNLPPTRACFMGPTKAVLLLHGMSGEGQREACISMCTYVRMYIHMYIADYTYTYK